MNDRLITAAEAVAIGRRILGALGTPEAAADQVARSLAEANLCGHDSHGIVRLPWYAGFVQDGRAVPDALPEVVSDHGAVAVIDGHRCWGQVAGHLAVEVATRRATALGVAAVTIRSANHLGRLGEYAERVAAQGLVAVMWCNADPSVAPFGGRARLLGTNPLAVGIPSGADSPPVIVDFATAAIAEGKLRLQHLAGRQVPAGLIQDSDGRPTTDPADFYAGGSLLPFGGHKGYGLALTIELLGGALSQNHVGFLPEYHWGNGAVLIVLDPAAFTDAAAFASEVARAGAVVRDSPPAAGAQGVLLPGDVERATRAFRTGSGIPVSQRVWDQLKATEADLGLSD